MNDIQESDRTQDRKSIMARIRVWRGINTSILVFSIFSPWLTDCDGTKHSGADLIANSSDIPPLAILALSFLIYLLLNTLSILWSSIEINVFLIGASILGSMLFLILLGQFAETLLWGYYLALLGLLSSLILETEQYRSRKQEKSDAAEQIEPT